MMLYYVYADPYQMLILALGTEQRANLSLAAQFMVYAHSVSQARAGLDGSRLGRPQFTDAIRRGARHSKSNGGDGTFGRIDFCTARIQRASVRKVSELTCAFYSVIRSVQVEKFSTMTDLTKLKVAELKTE